MSWLRKRMQRRQSVARTLAVAEELATSAFEDMCDTLAVDPPTSRQYIEHWSPRYEGRCLACNGNQHDACEGKHPVFGDCRCTSVEHKPRLIPAWLDRPSLNDVPGTHRGCREAAARVCQHCRTRLGVSR